MPRRLSLYFLVFFTVCTATATHLRSGEISVFQENMNSLTVKITVTVFTNVNGTPVLFGGDDDWLDLGDGTIIKVPETLNTMRPDLGDGIAIATFMIQHTYSQMGKYVISYSEPNRNEGVINMDASVNTRFYLETMIMLQANTLCRTPTSQVPQVYTAGMGEFALSLASADSVGNRLLYEKTVPKKSRTEVVENYHYPEAYSLNPYSGLVKWDTKFQGLHVAGNYAFAVKINQVSPAGKIVGYVVRDFQIVLLDITSPSIKDTKELDENNRIYMPPSQTFTFLTTADTSDRTDVNLYAYSELSEISEAFHFSTWDSISTSTGAKVKVGKLQLTNVDAIRRDVPYLITIRAAKDLEAMLFTHDVSYMFFTNDVPTIIEVTPEEPGPVTSVEPESTQSIAVYPNPFVDNFTVESSFSSNATLMLRDLQGRKVWEHSGFKKTIDGSLLGRGVYMLVVSEGKRSLAIKLVKH